MSDLPDVNPGELITAEHLNDIKACIEALEGDVQTLFALLGTGNVIVPNVLGQTLGAARAMLTAPTLGLFLGNVFDAYGMQVDPDLSASFFRIVINQMPQAGDRINTATPVDLVIAAIPGSDGGVIPVGPPRIDGFSQSPVPIGETVFIIGENFVDPEEDNQVTVDGEPAPVLSGTSGSLLIRIPETVAPPTGGAATRTVVVVVTVPSGDSASAELEVSPPPQGDLPIIDDIVNETGASAATVLVDQAVTIVGSNFNDDAVVRFDDVQAEITSADTNQIQVVVPQLPGHNTSGDIVGADVTVEVGGRVSDPFGINVMLVIIN